MNSWIFRYVGSSKYKVDKFYLKSDLKIRVEWRLSFEIDHDISSKEHNDVDKLFSQGCQICK